MKKSKESSSFDKPTIASLQKCQSSPQKKNSAIKEKSVAHSSASSASSNSLISEISLKKSKESPSFDKPTIASLQKIQSSTRKKNSAIKEKLPSDANPSVSSVPSNSLISEIKTKKTPSLVKPTIASLPKTKLSTRKNPPLVKEQLSAKHSQDVLGIKSSKKVIYFYAHTLLNVL